MVNITKAIIHILNPEQGITIQSRNELDITSGTTYQYVNSLIEKAFNISQLKFGNFASNSTVLSLIRQYKNNESEFGEISRTISERMYESLSATEKSKDRIPSDVIVAEFIKDEVKYIAILKCENKVEYLHRVINTGNEVTVEIADINSILPPKTKVVTECSFIDLEKEEVFYKDKKYQIDGETAYIMSDIVLECICETASDKEVSSYITKALNKIYSDEPIQQIESAVKYKDFMIDNINKKNTKYTLNEVIENTIQAPSDRQVIIDNAVKKGIVGDGEDTLSISNYSTKKTNEKIRVIGDDVVDIKFDAELYKNSDRMSISVADDGTYTVTVKGLNSLTVK